MSLHVDFVNEVEVELDAARRSFAHDRARTAALKELHRIALAVNRDFGRPTARSSTSSAQPARFGSANVGSHSFATCVRTLVT